MIVYRQQDYGCGFVHVQVGRGVHDGLRLVSLTSPMAVLSLLTDVGVMAPGELRVTFWFLDISAIDYKQSAYFLRMHEVSLPRQRTAFLMNTYQHSRCRTCLPSSRA